jgi:RNA polymerase sigma-70 factor (ECF subfamily)
MEDRLLVLRCKRGNAGAMARIYEKYRKDLLILAIALLNDKAAAEDIVHDVFVSFVESLAQFHLTGSLKAYLMTCTANRARNHNKVRQRVDSPQEAVFEEQPVERLVSNERLQRLAAAMEQLPYEQREILMLHSYGGLTLRAIAKTSGLPANTVMSRYRYGVDKLRHLLNGECDHET